MNPKNPHKDSYLAKAWELGFSHTEFKPPLLQYYGKDHLLEAYIDGFEQACELAEQRAGRQKREVEQRQKFWDRYWD